MPQNPDYPEMEWRCSCGEHAYEPGTGDGLKSIRRHQMGQTGHKIEGLYESSADDAMLLVAGPSRKKATELGYLADPPPDASPAPEPAKGGGGSSKKSATNRRATNEGNINGNIPFAQLRLKASTWPWLSILMRIATKDDGNPYEDTNEGLADLIYDCVETEGRRAIALASGYSIHDERLKYVTDLFRGSVRMKQTTMPKPKVAMPEPEYTNVEDVLKDAFREIERDAAKMAFKAAGSEALEEEVYS